MDSSIMEEMLDTCMQYHFELCASQDTQPQHGGLVPIPSMALLAFAPCLTIYNNCKKGGHTVEFCIAPGGKLAGLFTCYSSRLTLCLITYAYFYNVLFVTLSEVPASVACNREYDLHKMDCLFCHSGSLYPT